MVNDPAAKPTSTPRKATARRRASEENVPRQVKKRPPRQPGQRSTKKLSDADLELRRTLTFRLHAERRMPFRQISEALAKGSPGPNGREVRFEVSPSQCRTDYWLVLRRDGYLPDPDHVDAHRDEQLEQCERLKEGLATRAFKGDPAAARTYLRVMDHEAKLAGLYRQPDTAAPPQLNPGSVALSELIVADEAFRQQLSDGLLARYGATSDRLN